MRGGHDGDHGTGVRVEHRQGERCLPVALHEAGQVHDRDRSDPLDDLGEALGVDEIAAVPRHRRQDPDVRSGVAGECVDLGTEPDQAAAQVTAEEPGGAGDEDPPTDQFVGRLVVTSGRGGRDGRHECGVRRDVRD